MAEAQVLNDTLECKNVKDLRSSLAQAELQAVQAALVAMAEHVGYWTSDQKAMDPNAALTELDFVSVSLEHISDRIDRSMDMIRPEAVEQLCFEKMS